MSERSTLQFRMRPHFHPDRQEDIVVEVMRDGEVAATIYGSREGIHVLSERFDPKQGEAAPNMPFFLKVDGQASCVVPLLKAGEACPWCVDGSGLRPCPVCGERAPC